MTGLRINRAKSFSDFLAHFKCLRPNARPQPNLNWPDICVHAIAHGVDRHFDDTQPHFPSQTSPTRMCSGNPLPRGFSQQNGQTICHHDGASQSRQLGDAYIRCDAVRGVIGQLNQAPTVNLVQKNRFGPDGLAVRRSVGADRSGVISHMVAQVQALIGAFGNTPCRMLQKDWTPSGHCPSNIHGLLMGPMVQPRRAQVGGPMTETKQTKPWFNRFKARAGKFMAHSAHRFCHTPGMGLKFAHFCP